MMSLPAAEALRQQARIDQARAMGAAVTAGLRWLRQALSGAGSYLPIFITKAL
jgi:hypothetical protein